MTPEEFEKHYGEAQLKRSIEGYLTPEKYSDLLVAKARAESAAEDLALRERGENFEDKLRMVLHAYLGVTHWAEGLNNRVQGLSSLAPPELKEAIESLESLAEQLSDLALYSEEAEAVEEALGTQTELWELPPVSQPPE